MASPRSESSLSSADSDIEPPPRQRQPPLQPPLQPPQTHFIPSKRAASIAFSDHSPVSPHRRRPPPQPSSSTNHHDEEEELHHHHNQHSAALSEISSDTSGSAPGSPRDEEEFAEQITVCRWDGCNEDCGNMDHLVAHIHDKHIGARRAKYACEWDDCTRKGLPHASGYALRAHMRSHTREKPFYCTLPECDRSFTRSDALAKHMRTVHETEALRPSDPIPKSHPHHPQNIANATYADALLRRQNRISSLLNGTSNTLLPTINITTIEHHCQHSSSSSSSPSSSPSNGTNVTRLRTNLPLSASSSSSSSHQNSAPPRIYYPSSDPFDPDEIIHPPRELYRYLKLKEKWAKQEHEHLKCQLEGFAKRRREAWIKKELLLEKCLRMELRDEEANAVSIFYPEPDKEKKIAEMKARALDMFINEEDENGEEEDDDDDDESHIRRRGIRRNGNLDASEETEDEQMRTDNEHEGEIEASEEE